MSKTEKEYAKSIETQFGHYNNGLITLDELVMDVTELKHYFAARREIDQMSMDALQKTKEYIDEVINEVINERG